MRLTIPRTFFEENLKGWRVVFWETANFQRFSARPIFKPPTCRRKTSRKRQFHTKNGISYAGRWDRTLGQDTGAGHWGRALGQGTGTGHWGRALGQDTGTGHSDRHLDMKAFKHEEPHIPPKQELLAVQPYGCLLIRENTIFFFPPAIFKVFFERSGCCHSSNHWNKKLKKRRKPF